MPSKPGHPVTTLDGGVYVTLEWTEPEDNGGADVTGYVIKYSEGQSDVDEFVDGKATNFQFTDQLNEVTLYRFAVAAVNAAGRGEFSEFTDYVDTLKGVSVNSLQFSILQCT